MLKSLATLFCFFCSWTTAAGSGNRSFLIDYDHDRFVKDGEPYRYISGSIHYFRIPAAYWSDRLYKMKAAGLNAVEFYIPWNFHELAPGEFEFSGDANVTEFIRLAQKNGLDVILRMGPYVCGEWDNGGIPWWLMKVAPSAVSRTKDPEFLYYVNKWYFRLFPMIMPLLYKNGGPVIMLQVENEYGSYYACDHEYTGYLKDMFRSYFGDDVVLFTVDGGALSYLKCGYTQGLYPTVDFGTGDRSSIWESFAAQRAYSPRGPLVNTEFYPGWLDVWGVNHSTVDTRSVLESMTYMYEYGASFNFYMFHGGTTFGFWNGATGTTPCITSYDYDAPLSEAADPTPKYVQIRELIENLTGVHNTYPLPKANPKKSYGRIEASLIGTVLDLLHVWSDKKVSTQYPLTFENISFGYGYVLYETSLPDDYPNANADGKLIVQGIRDRGYVMVDGQSQGILSNRFQKYQVVIRGKKGQKLRVLVENLGRHTQGLPEPKGIVSNVTLNDRVLTDWTLYPITIEDLFAPLKSDKPHRSLKNILKSGNQVSSSSSRRRQSESNTVDAAAANFLPSVYYAKFTVDGEPEDTFFHPGNWSKGQMFLNQFNVGRYWPDLGPQVTMYVPKPLLKSGSNYALIFEMEQPGNCEDGKFEKCSFSLIDYPILNKTVTVGRDPARKPLRFSHL